MTQTIINTVVTFIVSGLLGYCVKTIKGYKTQKNDIMGEFKHLKESQLCDMRSDLSNKFYIYDAMEEVEDYLYLSWMEKAERYFTLGGNAYVHQLYEKAKTWKIKPTNFLK